jgi:hypothetical protein
VLFVRRGDAFYLPTHIAISYELTTEQLLIISLTAEMEKSIYCENFNPVRDDVPVLNL